MLKETTLYTAICDRCEKELTEYYRTESILEKLLLLHNWHDTGELHFCPSCYTINENDELTIKPQINETND